MFYHLDGVIENELNSREQWVHCLADVTTEEPLVRSLAQAHSLIKVVLRGFRCALGAVRWCSWETFLSCFSYFRVKIFGRCLKKKKGFIFFFTSCKGTCFTGIHLATGTCNQVRWQQGQAAECKGVRITTPVNAFMNVYQRGNHCMWRKKFDLCFRFLPLSLNTSF